MDPEDLYAMLGIQPPAGGVPNPAMGLGTEPLVLMGYERVRNQVRQPRIESNMSGFATISKRIDKTIGLTAAVNLIYTDPKQRQQIADRLVSSGIIPPDWTDQQLASAWANAVKTASDIYTIAGKPMTPFDVLALQGQAPGGGGEGMSPRTVVNKQINISTPEEARSLLRMVLGQALGRGPSESELDDFQAQLNAAQRANPSVTTTRYGAGGGNVSSTTTGGMNPQAFADEYVNREFGTEEDDYQLVSELMPALFETLPAAV